MFSTIKVWVVAARFWLIAGLVTAVLVYVGTLHWDIHTLRTKLSESKVKVEEAGRTIDKLQTAVVMQNQAVEVWRAEAARRSQAAKAALDEASKFRKASESKAKVIYSIVPKGDECEDLRTIIDTARSDSL